ncbi:uncharacterized protein LOC124973027 isoform X4 [Sciurus carolinensis]|uniref:uncharacterized protein LOC124973027 isoform X4 n=1 Tax=Sciurus carolinensis TaxID=30640 RepID=UPI001FB3EEFC|nr:uncharacterized protein LOC124973027 isoform X4 [Sciurus carolinensis]
MPKNKGKGGKNRRRGKNENESEKRELVFKEDGQEYAQVWINSSDIILVGLRDYQLKSMKQIHLVLEMMMKFSLMILEMMMKTLMTSKLNSVFLRIIPLLRSRLIYHLLRRIKLHLE